MDKNEFNEAMNSIKTKNEEVQRLDGMLENISLIGDQIISCPLPMDQVSVQDAVEAATATPAQLIESSNPNFIKSVQSIYRNEIVRQRNALYIEIADLMSWAIQFIPVGGKKVDVDLKVVEGDKTDTDK